MQHKKTIVIAGGTGLVGQFISASLSKEDFQIVILTRKPTLLKNGLQYIQWDPLSLYIDPILQHADMIINLAGEGIADNRWTSSRKRALIESRLQSVATIKKWLEHSNIRPELYIGASAVGYYGDRNEEKLDEFSTPGDDFLAKTCIQWEEASTALEPLVERLAIVRIGVVLSMKGGALPKMFLSKSLGILSYFGKGRQFMPWIHIKDLFNILLFVIQNPEVKGVYNAVAPQEITNRQSIQSIAKLFPHVWLILSAPSIVLKLVLGEMSTVVLSGQRVIPQRLKDEGFTFHFTDIKEAIQDLMEKT
ncbi:MAG: TIGR01777 family oxidoreductase [Saprospiraceae bacterium]